MSNRIISNIGIGTIFVFTFSVLVFLSTGTRLS